MCDLRAPQQTVIARDDTTGVSGPYADLERGRPGAKAGGVQDLLQRTSRSPVAQWQHAGRTFWPAAARSGRRCPLRLAAPLPRSVPNADRGVIYEFARDTLAPSKSPRAGLRESAAALRKRRWNSLDPRFHLALSDDRIEMSGQSPGEQTASPIGRLSCPPQEEESCDV
jgi:hypothetical protein